MLRELHIQNFAIITDLTLKFKPGLVVLTGETGAGKSIILDALSAVLGTRVDSGLVRAGSNQAFIEAVFELDDATLDTLKPLLEQEGLLDEERFLTLSREIRMEGRSIARVNGRSVNLSIQSEIGAALVDVHGQSEHLSLLKVKSHRQLLDRFAGNSTLLQEYQKHYRIWSDLKDELLELERVQSSAEERADILRYQIGQIEAAKLKSNEEENLLKERMRLANAETLSRYAQSALQTLDETSPDTNSVTDLLGSVSHDLASLAKIDPQMQTLADQAETALSSLTDVAYELRHYSEQIEFNPARLDQIELRIDLINSLKKKHGGSIESVLKFLASAQEELSKIEGVEGQIKEVSQKLRQVKETLAIAAQELSESRQQAANKMRAQMEEQLSLLEMKKTRLKVLIDQQEDVLGLPIKNGIAFDLTGMDKVELLIETNPGEGFKPLAKIASGGETSRLMLALKEVLAEADQISTLVFDEIDSGIGGRVGMTVGSMLWQLGRHHQVMCVTHLPQLAAFGDQHFKVDKKSLDDRTMTQVQEVTGERRVTELAEMLGSPGEQSVQTARELLSAVGKITSTIQE
ncbi:MAG: DNA repair protein RecN [Anaerolineaceae bacterium]|jgi:DNA repair protein RecN (Recombination protein N)|nr:DNA repair protein RecN [Anaerolineaceae bacterium]